MLTPQIQKVAAGLLAVGLAVFFLLAGLARAEELTQEEREYLRQKDVIVFISQTHYPPFEFTGEDGDHTGMCIELARWIATRFGFKTRFIDTSFKQAQGAVLNGEADVLTSLFYSEKRDQIFGFTQVMFRVPAFIFVAADRPDIKGVQDLNGKTVAMQDGDYAQEFLEPQRIKFQVAWTKNFAEATDLVIAGQADAIIGDEQIVLYHIYSNRLAKFIKKVGTPLYIGQNCMAVDKDSHLLQSILNKGISLAKQTGTLDRINATWLGVEYKVGDPFSSRYWSYLVAGAALLALLALLSWRWNVRLRSLVAKRTEALARSEATLKTILAKSPLGIGLVKNRVLVWHNEAMLNMLGYQPGELEGLDPKLILVDPREYLRTNSAIIASLRNKEDARVDTQCLRKDGSAFDCLLDFALLEHSDSNTTMIVIAQDISEQKQAAEALRRSEEQFRFLAEGMTDIIWTVDLNFQTTYVSPSVEKMLGFTPEERKLQSLEEMVTPDSTQRILEAFARELPLDAAGADPDRSVKMEVEYYRKDGSTLWVENVVRAIRDAEGEVVGLHGVSRDISERKRAEAKLAELAAIVASSQESIISMDLQGVIISWNQGAELLYGYSAAEAVGRHVSMLVPKGHRDQDLDYLHRALASEKVSQYETVRLRRDGSVVDVSLTLSSLLDDSGQQVGVAAIARDISERKRAEEEKAALEANLRHAQKMQAVGTLTGGIAHEFNNLLAIVMGYAEKARDLGLQKQENTGEIDQIIQAADRASALVRQMLVFSRKLGTDRRPLSLNNAVIHALKMLGRTIPRTISIETDLAPDLPPVEGDGSQLEQILINLVTNARDAMPEGGKLTIKTELVSLSEKICEVCGGKFSGEHALLTLTDTGPSMDQHTKGKVFEPFFSTKGVGKGTGLGLSVVLGMVQDHTGHISCTSTPGMGTTFEIYLPALGEEEMVGLDDQPSLGQAPGGTETLLLVDDEQSLLSLCGGYLAEVGYQIIKAQSGEETLDIDRARGGEIDLVVLDLGMPGMGGQRCLQDILSLNPQAKEVIASGYTDDAQIKASLDSGAMAFVAKPYKMADLLASVREVLDR